MGIRAIGEVGDPDPYTATMDAVREYHPERDHHLHLPGDALGLAAPRPDRARPPGDAGCRSSTSSPTPTPRGCRSTSRSRSPTAPPPATSCSRRSRPRSDACSTSRERRQLFIVVVPQEGGDGHGDAARPHAAEARARPPARARPVRRRHDRRPGPVHGDHERASVLPRRRHRDLDLRGDEVGLAAGRPDRAGAPRDRQARRARRPPRRATAPR